MAEFGSPTMNNSPIKGRCLSCRVLMLDDTVQNFQVSIKCSGQVLFDVVINKLQLVEGDYFDLQFNDHESIPCWLDREKLVIKQVSPNDLNFKFLVKFYTPDPGLLEEELSRYLFALQIKRDLLSGVLYCQEHTAVLLASFIVQAEVGNYSEELYDQNYLSQLKLLPNQTREVEIKIIEHHKEHVGQSPSEADFNLLDTARKVELYGINMHPAKDHEGISLNLAVAHMGIIVFQNTTKINSFSWAKIRKLCFKRKKFIIKLHPDGCAYNKDTVEFYFPSRNWSKNFWKKCIEHHAFFRCQSVRHVSRSKSKVVSRGSSFRYTGRTQKELVEFVRDNCVGTTPFERSTSMRTMSAVNSRAGTPKTGTLSSHDLHFGHHASFSSGSRTLDRSYQGQGNPPLGYDYPMSGSFDQNDMQQGRHLQTFQVQRLGYGAPPSGNIGENHTIHSLEQQNYKNNRLQVINDGGRMALLDSGVQYNQFGYPSTDRIIDPSQFMLSKDGQKLSSSAVFAGSRSSSRDTAPDERFLEKSPESNDYRYAVGNVSSFSRGQKVQYGVGDGMFSRGPASFHQDSATTASEDDLPPPPPPPIFEEETRRQKARLVRENREDTLATGTSKSTTSAASFTLTSNASIISSQTDESEEDSKKRKYPTDRAYYIVKELIMTERTYKKDLEVVIISLKEETKENNDMPEYLKNLIFSLFAPIYDCHCRLLTEIEQRIVVWEGRHAAAPLEFEKRICDILLCYLSVVLQCYRNYLDRQEEIFMQMSWALKNQKGFEQLINDFENEKVCYLPFNAFLFKPIQRLLHYKLLTEKLLNYYTKDHVDSADCEECLALLSSVTDSFKERLRRLENWQKLMDIQRDVSGLDNLVQPNRLFIREGSLQKLSRKGYQQRLFFLFSDFLVYTSRIATTSLQFKVHGQLSLKGMTVADSESNNISPAEFCFTVHDGSRCLMLAASSQEEKNKWLEDIQRAILMIKEDDPAIAGGAGIGVLYPSLKSNSSSEALDDCHDDMNTPSSPDRQMQQRANTTVHVCWHRSTSVGLKDHHVALLNQLSGYLLRKFKNSNGWQKLWVVFTNFCLFFYKNSQDDYPLASLPLLGYSVCTPSAAEAMNKDFVFKLQFKNHVYFFRAESEHTFERWVEVIRSVTCTARITRAFSRMESTTSPILSTHPTNHSIPTQHQF